MPFILSICAYGVCLGEGHPWVVSAAAITAVGTNGKQNYVGTEALSNIPIIDSTHADLSAIVLALEYAQEKCKALGEYQAVDVTITTTTMHLAMLRRGRQVMMPLSKVLANYADTYKQRIIGCFQLQDLFDRARICYKFLVERGKFQFAIAEATNPRIHATHIAAFNAVIGVMPPSFISNPPPEFRGTLWNDYE